MAEDIGSLAVKLSIDGTGFQEGIGKINREMRVLDSAFKANLSTMGATGKGLDGLKAKQEHLSKTYQLSEQKVKALEEAHRKSLDSKGADAKATQDLEIKLNRAREAMAKVGRELQETNADIQKQSNQWYKLQQSLTGVSNKFKSVGATMSNIGQQMSMKVTLPIVGVGVAAGRVGIKFEEQMSRVKAITGATAEEFAMLEENARTLGKATKFSSQDAAEGMENLAAAGFSVTETTSAMPGMLNLAAAAGADLALSSEIAASTIRGFGLEASQAGHMADVFAQAANMTNAAMPDMGEAMKYVAPIAKSLGLSFEETAASIGVMADAGIKGSQAGTTLRGALSRLANPPKNAAIAMNELGVSFFDANGKLKPMGDIIGSLSEKFKELTPQQQAAYTEMLFGKNAMTGMLALINAGPEKLNALSDSFKNSAGAADEAAKIMQDSAGSKIEQMFGSLEDAGISITKALAPAIIVVADTIAKLADAFTTLPEPMQGAIIGGLAFVAAIGPIMSIVGGISSAIGTLTGIMASVSGAMTAGGTAATALGTAFTAITGPIGIAIAAIVAIGAALTSLYEYNEGFRNSVNKLASSVGEAFKGLFAVVGEAINALLAIFKTVGAAIGPDVINVITSAFEIVANTIEMYLNVITNILKVFTSILKGDWQGAWEAVKNIVSSVLNGVKKIITSVLKTAWNIVKLNLNAIKMAFTTAFNGIKSVVLGVLNWFVKTTASQINAVKDTVKNGLNAIKSFFTNLKLPAIKIPKIKLPHFTMTGSFSVNPPSVPSFGVNWYAKGGIFNSPSIIGVGEAGQEAVIPISKLDSLMASAIRKAGGNGLRGTVNANAVAGETNYNIVINNPKPEKSADSIRRALLKHSYGLV